MREAFSEIFVMVGFAEAGFPRLVKAMDELAGQTDAHVTMQIGNGEYTPCHAEFFRFCPALDKFVCRADLVVSHGAMSAAEALLAGKPTAIAPRKRKYGEAIDDHQVEFAEALRRFPNARVVHEMHELGTAIESLRSQVVTIPETDPSMASLVEFIRSRLASWEKGQ